MLDGGDAVFLQPGLDLGLPGGVEVNQQDGLLAGQPRGGSVLLEERPQAAEQPQGALILDTAVLDGQAERELAITLRLPAQVVADLRNLDVGRLIQGGSEVFFHLRLEGGHAPVVNEVLEPGPLAVGPVGEVACDLDDRLSHAEQVRAGDRAERLTERREGFAGTRGRAQSPSNEDVVADQLAVLDQAEEAEVIGVNVSAVIVGQGESCFELALHVGLAVDRLDGVVSGGGDQGGAGNGHLGIDDLLAIDPDVPVGGGSGGKMGGEGVAIGLHGRADAIGNLRRAGEHVAFDVSAGGEGGQQATG